MHSCYTIDLFAVQAEDGLATTPRRDEECTGHGYDPERGRVLF